LHIPNKYTRFFFFLQEKFFFRNTFLSTLCVKKEKISQKFIHIYPHLSHNKNKKVIKTDKVFHTCG